MNLKAKTCDKQTLPGLLKSWSDSQPEKLAFRQVDGDMQVVDSTSWLDLSRDVRLLAGQLGERGVRAGDRVLIATAEPLNYVRAILGTLWIGAIAVPLPHSRGRRAAERADLVAGIAGARTGIVEELDQGVLASKVNWIETAGIAASPFAPEQPLCQASDDALVQFTSGTTALPKGARLTHAALVANQRMIAAAFDHRPEENILGWLPLNHDLGLVGNVFQTLYLGCECTLLPSRLFASDPWSWLRAISSFRGTTSGGPDSAFELLTRLPLDPEFANSLDLTSWRRAYSGAEPIRHQTLERFASRFAQYGFDPTAQYNSYGLAEASLIVATGPARCPDGDVMLPPNCGPAAEGVSIRIVSPDTGADCGEGEEGEIWVASPSLATSYWGDAELTREKLFVDPSRTSPAGDTWLRTGDAGRLRAGRLEVGGRLDDRINIFGKKIAAHEVEQAVAENLSDTSAQQIAAFVDRDASTPGLALVLERPSTPQAALSRNDIAQLLRDRFGVLLTKLAVAKMGQLPRTTSGKVRRKACARQLSVGHFRLFDDTVETAKAVEDRPLAATIASRILDRELADFELDLPLRDLGIVSLDLARIALELEREAGVQLSPSKLLEYPSLRSLPNGREAKSEATSTDPLEARECATLSPMAKRLLQQSRLDNGAGASALAWAVRIEGPTDHAKLSAAWSELAGQFDALRARLDASGEDIVIAQRVPELQIVADEKKLADICKAICHERSRPFLPGDLLYRPMLFRENETSATLAIVAHHAVCDLHSLVELASRLFSRNTLADEAELEGRLPHHELAAGDTGDAQLPDPGLALATDSPAPAMPDFHGGEVEQMLSVEQVEQVQALAARMGVTPAELALSLWAKCLARLGDSEHCVMHVPVDLRPLFGDNSIGCGIGTARLHTSFNRTTPLKEFVQDCAARLRDAYANASRGFSAGDAAGPAARLDAAFSWYSARDSAWLCGTVPSARRPSWAGKVAATVIDLPVSAVQFALTLNVFMLRDGSARLRLDHSTARFERRTAHAILRTFADLLVKAAASDEAVPLGELSLCSPGSSAQVEGWSRGREAPALDLALPDVIQRQVERRGDAVALSISRDELFGGTALVDSVTYSQLEHLLVGMASVLRQRGVGRGDTVALILPRSASYILSALAIWRVGAAFVPISPDDPPQRQAALLDQLDPALTLHAGSVKYCGTDSAMLDIREPFAIEQGKAPASWPAVALDSKSYVIFTSGSTGVPKGVVVNHRAIARRIATMSDELGVTSGETVLHKTPVTFDVSLWEMFLPLANGATVCVAEAGTERDPVALAGLLESNHASIVHFVPSMLAGMVASGELARVSHRLRHVVCSGEALTADLSDKAIHALGPSAKLWNYYGPTEAAIDVSRERVRLNQSRVTIGRPVDGSELLVVDQYGHLAPPTGIGEILVGGDQLGEGYLGARDKTAAAFGTRDGRRYYRTGDKARWTAAGELDFLGRRDSQWKLRGHRIESAEIVAALREQSGIAEAAAVLVHADGIPDHIHGFFVASDPDAAPDPSSVRSSLAGRLPSAMIPARLSRLASLPLTAGGKLDTASLQAHAIKAWQSPLVPSDAQHDDVHGTVAILRAAMASSLGLTEIPSGVSYFDLGGDSISAIRMVALAAESGLKLSVADLYCAPEPQLLAQLVGSSDGDQQAELSGHSAQDQGSSPFPLCSAQQGLVYSAANDATYEVYTTSLTMSGPLVPDKLREAVQSAVDRHDFLRLRYVEDLGGEWTQAVAPFAIADVAFIDLSDLPPQARQAALDSFIASERRRRFDWTQAPMVRVTVHALDDEQFRLTLADPTMDGWCVANLLTEVVETYSGLLSGREPARQPAPTAFREFVALETKSEQDPECIAFWESVLARSNGSEGIRARSNESKQAGSRRIVGQIDDHILSKLTHTARLARVPLRAVAFAAHTYATWALRGRVGGNVGAELTGRPETAGGESALGIFNNIVPLPVGDEATTWFDLAHRAHEAELAALPYRRFPQAALRKMAGGPIADTVFVFTDFRPYRRIQEGAVTLRAINATDRTYVPVTAHMTRDPLGSGAYLLVDFETSCVSAEEAAGFASAFEEALDALAHRPYDKIQSVEAPTYSPPAFEPVSPIPLISAQARRSPDSVAIVQGEQHITYSHVERSSGAIAGALKARGASAETLVALDLTFGPDLLIAILGVLKAGAAFVPLDPSEPDARRYTILEKAGPDLVIRGAQQDDELDLQVDWLHFEDAVTARRMEADAAWPDSLAYVMFTSGSTGTPKGVMIGRHALGAYLGWAAEHYRFECGRGAGVVTGAGVDMSITSLLTPLMCGKCVELADTPGELSSLRRFAADDNLGVLKITPSHLDMLAAAGGLPSSPNKKAELVLGGERIEPRHLELAAEIAERITNEYGPTEATVGCMSASHPLPLAGDRIELGQASAPSHVTLEGPFGRMPHSGLPGEICIAGHQLARGYHRDSRASAACFLPTNGGARIYYSGDLAHRERTGHWYYRGRSDRMVKIAGVRTEPAEVEALLLAMPDISAAVCEPFSGPDGRLVLGACLVTRGTANIDVDAIRATLAPQLGRNRVPARIVEIDRLPLTRSGKIDRQSIARSLEAGSSAQDKRAELLRLVQSMDDAEVARRLAARNLETKQSVS